MKLNLAHFDLNGKRYDICSALSQIISFLPNLIELEINIENLINENVYDVIGKSYHVTTLTLYINKINISPNDLVNCLLLQYSNLKILKIHRPSFVNLPGFDKFYQDNFINQFNSVNESNKTVCKPTLIIFKNYEIDIMNGMKILNLNTSKHYIHVYRKTKGTYNEIKSHSAKKSNLAKFYGKGKKFTDSAKDWRDEINEELLKFADVDSELFQNVLNDYQNSREQYQFFDINSRFKEILYGNGNSN